jgi:hypothetical protein
MTSGTEWLEQAQRLFDALRAPGGPAPADPSSERAQSTDCRSCPICQFGAVLRGERPEVTEALADILATTATALRTFAGAAQTGPPDAGEPADAEAQAPPPVVQRIEIA